MYPSSSPEFLKHHKYLEIFITIFIIPFKLGSLNYNYARELANKSNKKIDKLK